MYFYLDIEPKAQSRPRFSNANGYARAYEKADIKKWKMTVAEMIIKQMVENNWRKFMTGTAVAFSVAFSIPFPKSYSKKKRIELDGAPHIQKPDVDNYVKALFDALTGVLWEDDDQVSYLSATKAWGRKPCIIIYADEDTERLTPVEF